VGGFIPPPALKRRYRMLFDPVTGKPNNPMDLVQEIWQAKGRMMLPTAHITPLLRYDNHTMNPFVLYNLIWANVHSLNATHFPSFRQVNDLMTSKKTAIERRWSEARSCRQRQDEAYALMQKDRRAYDYKIRMGQIQEPMLQQCPSYKTPRYTGLSKDDDVSSSSWLIVRHETEFNFTTREEEHASRFTAAPTKPPVLGCDPTPQCFDLCCVFRSILDVYVQLLNMTARFFNGLIQVRIFFFLFFNFYFFF
jgi:hypothetical protein